jgi:DNA-binding CsgD family transcriptional regulator/tetratricopeptide (TPR) repeat protein
VHVRAERSRLRAHIGEVVSGILERMSPAASDDLLRGGREALAAGDWERARSCFEEAGEGAEALDGLGQALHFQGEYERAVELKERAFAAYRRRGMPVEAADLARWLAFLYLTVRGNMAAANGWMAQAEGLLAGVPECAAHGWLALDRAPWTDDPAERERHAEMALAIARRFGDRDLELSALALLGETYVASGRIPEGMTLLDQAMAAVTAGEVGIAAVGEIYCRLLSACERATDVSRAEQWMAVAGRFDAWSDFVPPTCRMHYGGLLIAIGRWTEAEQELLTAIRVFERGYRASRVFAVVRLADLRIRQGRFEEVEALLEGSEWHPTARRSLAMVALARRDIALAEDLTRVCLEGRDPFDPGCVPLLELLIDVQLARGDVGGARVTLDGLAELATACGNERVGACAELAAGRVCTAEGNDRGASHLRAALERFSALELPLEAARAQLELARAVAPTAPAAAVTDARVALRAFERLGAARDADAAAGLLRGLGAPGRVWPKHYGVLTKRETEVLSLLAAGCSNAGIGERLYISRRTAEHHVASILSKLGVGSRAEAAAYAVRVTPEGPVSE